MSVSCFMNDFVCPYIFSSQCFTSLSLLRSTNGHSFCTFTSYWFKQWIIEFLLSKILAKSNKREAIYREKLNNDREGNQPRTAVQSLCTVSETFGDYILDLTSNFDLFFEIRSNIEDSQIN